MTSSFKLFSVRGIDIRMHITFPLILVWAAVQFGYLSGSGITGAIFGVLVISFLFVIVTLHELGHSFAALYYDVPVKDIVLLPIGGVAQLKEIPENPWKEFVIAIAGPAVNFVLGIVLWLIAIPLGIAVLPTLATLGSFDNLTFATVFSYVFIYNLFLGVFNLLPAFPMDGGRILRALLAYKLPYTQATGIAAAIGRGLAWIMGLYGFLEGGFGLILIAFFIYIGAGQERTAVEVRAVLRGLTVDQAFSRNVHILRLTDTLQDAVDITLSSFQATFPVCNEVQQLMGVLPYTRMVEALRAQEQDTPVARVMLTDIPAISPERDLIEAQQLMRERRLEALPVIKDGRFLGLITLNDVSEVLRLLSVDPDLLPRRSKEPTQTSPTLAESP